MTQDNDTRRELAAAIVELRELERVIAVYYSGKEVAVANGLIKRAEACLNHEQPEPILLAMQKMIDEVHAAREARQQSEMERVSASEAEGNRQKAARDAMHARQAAERQVRIDRQMRAVALRAVKDVIG